MSGSIYVDFKEEAFLVRCPIWANDMVKRLPSRRWLKGARCWKVPFLRLNVEGMRQLTKMEGVVLTDAASRALDEYAGRVANKPVAGTFPSWYPFRTKLTRMDGTGVDEFKPYPHAIAVLNKKWGRKSFALHHDMGTAKTRTEIDYGCALRMEGKINAMLVLVKLSGRRNWKEQFNGPMSIAKVMYVEGWAPIPADVYLPSTDYKRQFEQWLNTPHDFKVMVAGIESLSQGGMSGMVEQFLRKHGPVFAVIDEAHMIANHKAERTQKCYEFRPLCEYRDTATGTPISTGPLNLFGQFEWLDPEIIGIGDFYAYRNRYAIVVEEKTKAGKKYPLVVGYRNLDELTATVAPYTDEVRKADVLDLPPKNYLPDVDITLTKEQRTLYDKIKKDGAYSFKGQGEQVVQNVLELALRLHQVAQGFMPTYTDTPYIGRAGDDRIRRVATWHPVIPVRRNPKIIELADICTANRQFIIWCSYRAALDAIATVLGEDQPNAGIVQIHGDVSEADRAAYRARYQKGDVKFMLGNTATGGQSDTWTACETMLYFDNSEKLIDRLQSEDRAHRGGLDHVVDYVDFVATGTVDVLRMRSIQEKMDLAEYIRRNIRDAVKMAEGGLQ